MNGVLVRGVAPLALALMLAPAAASAAGTPKDQRMLKEAKLIIEHNATDHDTGFQAFVDSEGWDWIELAGPKGVQLRFEGRGGLGELGLTELFFETVEPENKDKPLVELLAELPEGEYTFRGHEMIDGEPGGTLLGTVSFTHTIPQGPELLAPGNGEVVSTEGPVLRWGAVTTDLQGRPIEIIGYQLIVERDVPPNRSMIGKWGLSMVVPATTTSMALPPGFLEPHTGYKWEVLAIEKGGNQTLSSAAFRTR